MKIGLASDHGGYNLKTDIIKHLKEKGIECVDFGPDNSQESVDYPIFGEKETLLGYKETKNKSIL